MPIDRRWPQANFPAVFLWLMIPQKRCQSFLTNGYMVVWLSKKRVILKQRGKGETAFLKILI